MNPICELNKENVRPSDYNTHDYNKGDCTTRAMAYCLKGIMTYKQIEAEQYRLAAINGTRRNSRGTWDLVLKDFGYSWLQLNNQMKRGVIAKMLDCFAEPMLAISSGHVTAIHHGTVIDTWDSTRGMVYGLLVSKYEIGEIEKFLAERGIETERVSCPTRTIRHRRVRRWNLWW